MESHSMINKISNFILKNVWTLIIGSLILSTMFTLIVNYYNRIEVTDLMKNMYYMEYVEDNDKEMVLEVMTSSFLTMNNDATIKQAILHLKDGSSLEVDVDKEKSIFAIKTDVSNNISKRLYKFNSSSKVKEMKK